MDGSLSNDPSAEVSMSKLPSWSMPMKVSTVSRMKISEVAIAMPHRIFIKRSSEVHHSVIIVYCYMFIAQKYKLFYDKQ